MSESSVLNALNECFAAECRSVIGHLADSQPFVSWLGAMDQSVVRQIVADENRHELELAELINDLDGVPVSVTPATDVAGVHYLDLRYLLSRIIQDKQRLLLAYESASPRVGGDKAAAALISRITDDERRHLAELERIGRSKNSAR